MLIGIVSFYLSIVSLMLGWFSLSSRNRGKCLCVFRARGRRKNCQYVVLCNSSDFYITKNDVFQQLYLKMSNKQSRVVRCTLLYPTKRSDIQVVNADGVAMISFDYLAPRRFIVLRIIAIGKGVVGLRGILENCRKVYRRLFKYSLLYNQVVEYFLMVFTSATLILLIIYSFLIEDVGHSKFQTMGKVCFFLSLVVVYPAMDVYKNYLLLDRDAYKSIRRILANSRREEKSNLGHKRFLIPL